MIALECLLLARSGQEQMQRHVRSWRKLTLHPRCIRRLTDRKLRRLLPLANGACLPGQTHQKLETNGREIYSRDHSDVERK